MAGLYKFSHKYETGRTDEEVYRDAVTAVLGGRGLTKAAVVLAGWETGNVSILNRKHFTGVLVSP